MVEECLRGHCRSQVEVLHDVNLFSNTVTCTTQVVVIGKFGEENANFQEMQLGNNRSMLSKYLKGFNAKDLQKSCGGERDKRSEKRERKKKR